MRCGHKKKYGQLPSEEELKMVKSELYVSETMRRNMKRGRGPGPQCRGRHARGSESGWEAGQGVLGNYGG
jgi:hypothetical protein